MDEGHAPPDNDGHGLPPPLIVTIFDRNDLPTRVQGSPGEHQPTTISPPLLQTEHEYENSKEPYPSVFGNPGPSAVLGSTGPFTDTKASGQPDSSGKTEAKDTDNEAPPTQPPSPLMDTKTSGQPDSSGKTEAKDTDNEAPPTQPPSLFTDTKASGQPDPSGKTEAKDTDHEAPPTRPPSASSSSLEPTKPHQSSGFGCRKDGGDETRGSYGEHGNNEIESPALSEDQSKNVAMSTDVDQNVQKLKEEIETLKESIHKATARAEDHYASYNELTKIHRENILLQKLQAMKNQAELLKYYEDRYKSHTEEAQAKDRTVAHLRQALEIEQNTFILHLQADLEEIINHKAVDQGSRTIEEEGADEWPEECTQETSQHHDDGPHQIIPKLHQSGEKEDVGEAAEEKETSPRRVTEESSLDEVGIRRLKREYVSMKRRLIESEGRVKELKQVNDEMGKREEQLQGKVRALEGEKEAVKRTVTEAEEKAKERAEELRGLEAKLIETETRFKELTLEKSELNLKKTELEDRVNALEENAPIGEIPSPRKKRKLSSM
ncbi:hypothetical protein B9Z19DRAFT_1063484 [Tuber borchii]|uniref:Uncharacterized protein n=1 Tax=Tuber borchii TaxID=42251 RepID=A0A2T6ZY15_TUBBO|nr:hypothetical protein B9Z19DRAFT_1063484 [Tuber borchii]